MSELKNKVAEIFHESFNVSATGLSSVVALNIGAERFVFETESGLSSALFPIASLTKMFVAKMVHLTLQQKGLRSSVKISELLSDLPELTGDPTVQSLIDHQSGLSDYVDDESRLQRVSAKSSLLEATLEALRGTETAPHSTYSNTAYLVLGLVVEALCGESVEHAFQTIIARPYGLTSTRFYDPRLDSSLSRYDVGWSDGALFSTVEDMSRWLATIRTPDVVRGKPAGTYKDGLVWQASSSQQLFYWHSGSGPSFESLVIGCPETQVSLISFGSGEGVELLQMSDRYLEAFSLR